MAHGLWRRARGPAVPPGNSRRRVRAVFVATLFVFSLFAVQLLRLQGGLQETGEATRTAQAMLTRTKVLPADRGRILDRNDVELAGSVKRYDIAASQFEVAKYAKRNPQTKEREVVGVAGAAADLAPLLGKTQAEIEPLLTVTPGQKPKGWVPLAAKVTPDVWRSVKALRIPGVYEDEVSERSYPSGASTAPLLGWVGTPQPVGDKPGDPLVAHGGGGLEGQFDSILNGKPGEMSREYSLDDRVIPLGTNDITPAVPGRDVKLYLDRDLQWYAYNAVAEEVRSSDATWGVAVVMDRQARLLGLAQYPSFDPGRKRGEKDLLRNVAFQDTFEPGSTAKVMSIGAALAEGKVTPETTFSVSDSIKRADRTFKDSHSHPTQQLTVAGIMAQSSNTGTIMVGEKVAADRLEQYYRAFGLGETSNTGWAGETRGIMTAAKSWSGSQRYTVIFGQGLAISAIQAAGVFQTIANDGVRVPATLIEGEVDESGAFARRPDAQGVRVVSADVAGKLRRMMESVVGEGGTAKAAVVPGYRVAGKTGTSYIYENGAQAGYTASFIGMAPAEDPQLIVAVIVQNPKSGYYGGVAAAPVFRKVMTYALARAGIPPSSQAANPFELGSGIPKSKKSVSTMDGTTTARPDPSATSRTPAETATPKRRTASTAEGQTRPPSRSSTPAASKSSSR